MSLQDDIFDVEAALEGKTELEKFNHIMTLFGNLERDLKIQIGIIRDIRAGAKALKRILKDT